jgi:3-keto-5-aminohexanoate cleavage enzyme
MRKVIISVAPTSPMATSIHPDELVQEVLEARQAGAAMVHMHVRGLDGKLTDDLSVFAQVVDGIRAGSDIVIQASTGGVSDMDIQQRCAPLTLEKVETASLNVGSVNLGNVVYLNPLPDVRTCVELIKKYGKMPEIEIFEIGMIDTVRRLDEELVLPKPILYDLVLGHPGGSPATIEALTALRSCLPSDALWGITHAYRQDYSILSAAIAMGASLVRIGFEDSDYLSAGRKAARNAELVEKIAGLIRSMELEVATPDEARQMLNVR